MGRGQQVTTLQPCDLDADGVDKRCPVGAQGLRALALERLGQRVGAGSRLSSGPEQRGSYAQFLEGQGVHEILGIGDPGGEVVTERVVVMARCHGLTENSGGRGDAGHGQLVPSWARAPDVTMTGLMLLSQILWTAACSRSTGLVTAAVPFSPSHSSEVPAAMAAQRFAMGQPDAQRSSSRARLTWG